MKTRQLIARAALLLPLGIAALQSAAALPCDVADPSPVPAAKNVVFILVDDLGWTDLGCFGSSFYDTPNIDSLAAGGMQFSNAYAACPVCSPTRVSVHTGKFPARLHTTDYFGAPGPDHKRWDKTPMRPADYVRQLPLEETTLSEALKEAGYRTFFAGKWHMGGEGFFPEQSGFDINKGGVERGGPYGGKKYFSPYGNPKLEDGPDGEHLPDRLAREAARFIEESGDQPFFACLSFYSVHTPLMAREDLKHKYQARAATLPPSDKPEWLPERARKNRQIQNHAVYAGMVDAMDQAVGVVLDALKRLDLEDNTVVVLTSDNGGLSTSEGHPTSNLPLRAGKGWMYEGGIRVPAIVRAPGFAGGTRCDAPITTADYYPTLLQLVGQPLRPEQHLDGQSIVPLLQGGELPDRHLFWHYPHYGNQGCAPSGAVRYGDWKLIEWFEDSSIELFNLVEDIGETTDRSTTEPEIADRLLEQLHAWQKSAAVAMPTPNSR